MNGSSWLGLGRDVTGLVSSPQRIHEFQSEVAGIVMSLPAVVSHGKLLSSMSGGWLGGDGR